MTPYKEVLHEELEYSARRKEVESDQYLTSESLHISNMSLIFNAIHKSIQISIYLTKPWKNNIDFSQFNINTI